MSTTGERLSNYFGDRKLPTGDLASFVSRYWYVLLIAAIVALAAGLRLWDLGERAIHHDESIHLKFAWDITQGTKYIHDPVYHGPFQYFGTAATFIVLGDNNYTSRLFPALFGIALVGLPFLLRRQLGTVGAFVAAGMLTISPALLYFSRFARNDIYVAFFTLAIVICIWRYMEDRKSGWLIAMAPLLALSFAAKEVTPIIAAFLLVFVNVLLATQIVQQVRASREMSPPQIALAYIVTIPTAWLIAAVWSVTEGVRKRFSLTEMPAAVPILIILGTLTAPQFSAAIQKLPFITDNGYMAEGDVMRWTALLLILGGAYIGLLWNWRVWLIASIAFYAVFVLLFTGFFTNMPGFWTGIWGSMDYWLGQQEVRRGGQPDYYYFMLLPVYEFLPLIFALGGAMFYAFRGKLEQRLLAAAALILIATLSLISDSSLGVISEYRIQLAFVIAIGSVLFLEVDWFTRFLLFWTLSILFGLTVAGEKMPWLTVHLALPLVLLSAKVLNDMLSSLRIRKSERDANGETRTTLDPRVAGPLAGVALLAVVATLVFLASGPVSGLSVLAWLFSFGALVGVAWVVANVSWRTAGQVAGVGLFSVLMVFTIRASGTAAFDQGTPNGVPPEIFIYAQGSAGLGLVADNVFSAAEESGLGKDTKIIIDQTNNIWPWPWYVRDYNNVEYSNFTDDFSPEPGAIVLVGTSNQSKMEPFLDRYHEGIPYTHMWWFPELYKNLETKEFLADVVNGDLFDTWRRFFVDREVKNATSTPNMIAYIPKEFSAPVFPPKAPGVRLRAPELPAESVTVLARLGTELGQVSQPADVEVDALGNVYVVDTLNHRVQIIAPDGTVTSIGESGNNAGQFANPRNDKYEVDDGPWGMTLGAGGAIYVADTWAHRIQRFSAELQLDVAFNIGGLFGPRDIAVMADGNLIVVDTGNKRLGIYDQSGNLQRIIGEEGDGRGEFSEPSSISISSSGAIYVADYWNKRIQRFDSQMRYSSEFEVESWGSRGTTDRAYIVALADGTVLATDPANGNILIFNANGEEIAAWSLPSQAGTSRPIGIAVDPAEENVYITDGLASQVVRVPLAVLLGPPPPDSTP
ncbi:MAG: TIGR03663 family protein [Chloroflexi bacterium]|nr:TIGR03663 family protein [Chloroflexota bacterium]